MDRADDRARDLRQRRLVLELLVDLEVDGSPELDAVVGMDRARGRVVWLGAGDTVIQLWQWYHPSGRDLPADDHPILFGDKEGRIALANRTNEENQKLHDRMISTMIEKLGYCRTCSQKTIEYFCTQVDET